MKTIDGDFGGSRLRPFDAGVSMVSTIKKIHIKKSDLRLKKIKLSSGLEFLVWFNYNFNAAFTTQGQLEGMVKLQPVKI